MYIVGFQEIFEFAVLSGRLAITWFNSYSGIIVKTPRATLIFDPVKLILEDCIQATAVVITHEHLDHFDPKVVKELQQKTGAPIFTTPFVARNLLKENVRALRVGESTVIKDVELHALRCDHPANEPISFIVSSEDGITVYHPGDSDVFPEMAEVATKYKPDILLYVGASVGNAAQIASLIHPKVAVSFYSDEESERKFAEAIRRETPDTQAKLIKRFEIYQYPEL